MVLESGFRQIIVWSAAPRNKLTSRSCVGRSSFNSSVHPGLKGHRTIMAAKSLVRLSSSSSEVKEKMVQASNEIRGA